MPLWEVGSIAHHNKVVHLLTETLQANKHTRFYTLTNVGNLKNKLSQNGSEMYMPANKLSLLSQIKTRYTKRTRSSKPHTSTTAPSTHIRNTIH